MYLVKLYVQPRSSRLEERDMQVQGEYEVGITSLDDMTQLAQASMWLFRQEVQICCADDFMITLFYQGVQLPCSCTDEGRLQPPVEGYVFHVTHALPEYMKAPETLYEYANEVNSVLGNLMPYVLSIDMKSNARPVFDQAHRLLLKTKQLIKKIQGVSNDDNHERRVKRQDDRENKARKPE